MALTLEERPTDRPNHKVNIKGKSLSKARYSKQVGRLRGWFIYIYSFTTQQSTISLLKNVGEGVRREEFLFYCMGDR